MKYTELSARQQKEVDAFPMQFAFSDKQLQDGLERLGATKDDVVGIGGGGFIRKSDSDAFFELFKRHTLEMAEALRDDDFMLDAIEYELGNHEYCITYDPEPALSAVGVSLDDERVAKLFPVAKKNYLEACREYERQAA